MEFIGYPDPEYTIICTIKETMYINKDSVVGDMRYLLHMPMVAVNIYVLCDTFVHFTLCSPQVYFVLESLLYIFPVQG